MSASTNDVCDISSLPYIVIMLTISHSMDDSPENWLHGKNSDDLVWEFSDGLRFCRVVCRVIDHQICLCACCGVVGPTTGHFTIVPIKDLR